MILGGYGKPVETADGAIFFDEGATIRELREEIASGRDGLQIRQLFAIDPKWPFVWEFSIPATASPAWRSARDVLQWDSILVTSRRDVDSNHDLDRLDFEKLRASWPGTSPRRTARVSESPVLYVNHPPGIVVVPVLVTVIASVKS